MEGNRNRRVGRQTEDQFFALLRSGLWNEVPDRFPFAGGTDWEALYRLSLEQTVVPLVTDGINRLPREFLPAEPKRLDPFLGDMMATAKRNRVLDGFIPKIFNALQFFNRLFRNLTQISDIGKLPDAEGITNQGIMLQFYGNKV